MRAVALALRTFTEERHWQQYHTAKNLVMALCSEVGELADLYRWLRPDEQPERAALEGEVADVAIFLLRLCDVTGVDMLNAVAAKMACNEARFPKEG